MILTFGVFFVADAELKFSILDVFDKPFGVTMT
jgi:hypothetical protein